MRKKYTIVALIIICAIGALFIYWHYNSSKASPTLVPQKQKAPLKSSPNYVDTSKPSQDVPSDTSIKLANLSFTQSNGQISASADVNNADTKSGGGTCVFDFTKEGAKPVVRQQNSQISGGVVKCAVSGIPEVEFSMVGTWTMTVHYYLNNTQASKSQDVTVN